MPLRVVAISAPEHYSRAPSEYVLTSRDPASLYNACRYSASLAESNNGPWANSNWADSRERRRQSTLLMHSLHETQRQEYIELLTREAPNLLLIGAMTLCLPGAVQCALIAKQVLGDRVCIVLGGWHASETIYTLPSQKIEHHPGSPLQLMANASIPRVFDLVVAGEGDFLIARLGDLIDELQTKKLPPASLSKYLDGIETTPGRWILGWVTDNLAIRTLGGRGVSVDRGALPTSAALFGVTTRFGVFDDSPTAHVFSDSNRGCAYDCSFCSERLSSTGPLQSIDRGPENLYRQLKAADAAIQEDYPGSPSSAFIEDSLILEGSPIALNRFASLLEKDNHCIRFGGQLTIDQIFQRRAELARLRAVGLSYLFVGIETPDPKEVGNFSKNTRERLGSWMDRIENTLRLLRDIDIRVGSAILFGLGETHSTRLHFLNVLHSLLASLGSPWPISLNWAVQHPLKGMDGNTGYEYLDWGVPPGDWTEAFEDFGEASVIYPLSGQPQPILKEVIEVKMLFRELFGNMR